MDDPAEDAPPRADLADAAGWLALGAAVLAGSLSMDRLANQDVPPFAAPGLMPGLLGIALLLMGGTLLVRSLRRGALVRGAARGPAVAPGRALLVIALCVAFGAGLVGHGLPFWAASALFVTTALLLLRPRPVPPMAIVTAALTGLGAGLAITLVFQQIFLVRLP